MNKQREILITDNQTTNDIIRQICIKHLKCIKDYDQISQRFNSAFDNRELSQTLYNYCKKNITYRVESENRQTISSPSTILSNKQGDCKHYALFIAGVVDSLKRQGRKINWCYRFAGYDIFRTSPEHVFVVVKEKDGSEIWIDPVLKYFDYKKPYVFAIDKYVNTMEYSHVNDLPKRSKRVGMLSGIPSVNTGQPGGPALRPQGRVGFAPVIVYAAVQLVSLAIKVFGNNYSVQASHRWLIQLYQQFVLGQTGITASNANQSLDQTTMVWFSNQLGVPVLDRTMFDMLKGYADPQDAGLHRETYEQRATNYKTHLGTENVTYAQALKAAKLTDKYLYALPPGGWKNIPPASQFDDNGNPIATAVPGLASLLPSGLSSTWIWFIALAAGAFFIFNKPKTFHKK